MTEQPRVVVLRCVAPRGVHPGMDCGFVYRLIVSDEPAPWNGHCPRCRGKAWAYVLQRRLGDSPILSPAEVEEARGRLTEPPQQPQARVGSEGRWAWWRRVFSARAQDANDPPVPREWRCLGCGNHLNGKACLKAAEHTRDAA